MSKPGAWTWVAAWIPAGADRIETRIAETRDGALAYAGHVAYSGGVVAVAVLDTQRAWAVWCYPAKVIRLRTTLPDGWRDALRRHGGAR